MTRTLFVYILASCSGTLYIGVTNDLTARLGEHRTGIGSKFTKRYNVTRLVYFEEWDDALAGISREKQLKGWRREKKIELIESANPAWNDLADELLLRSPNRRGAWRR